jgi:hypothetical protein
MREGDLVRLKQSFLPMHDSLHTYRFGQVVALVTVDARTAVLIYLCDRQGHSIYTDEKKQPVIYSFWSNEVEWLGDRANNTGSVKGTRGKNPRKI